MHEIMPMLMEYAEGYDSSKGAFSTWLIGSIKWACMARLKRRKAQRHHMDVLLDELRARAIYSYAPSPEDILMKKEYISKRREAIRSGLGLLSISERYLVRQRFYKKRTLADIAKEEGFNNHNSVQYRIDIALDKMRCAVQPYAVDLGR